MKLTPVVYAKCGHGLNVIAGSVHDPDSSLAEQHAQTGEPVVVHWDGGRCQLCNGPIKFVGQETVDTLAKAKGY